MPLSFLSSSKAAARIKFRWTLLASCSFFSIRCCSANWISFLRNASLEVPNRLACMIDNGCGANAAAAVGADCNAVDVDTFVEALVGNDFSLLLVVMLVVEFTAKDGKSGFSSTYL